MKNTLLAFAVVFGTVFTAQAQDSSKSEVRIQASIGSAFASGDYGKTSDFLGEGDAKTGVLSSIGLAWDLHPNFGLGLTLAGRVNPVDTKGLTEWKSKEIGTPIKVDADSYTSALILTDIYGQLPISNITVYAKASAGYGTFKKPTYTFTTTDSQGNEGTGYQPSGKGTDVVFGLAAGTRYNFGRFNLGLEVGYLTAKPEIEFDSFSSEHNLKQEMNSINSSLTLSYKIR